MELANKELAAKVEAANIQTLNWRIYIADDLEGLNEAEWLEREAQRIIEDYTEDGHALHDELKHARWLLKRTDNGKRIPIDPTKGFRPVEGFTPSDIESARHTVDEYKAVRAFVKKMKG